jgi:hypothetical protein
MLKEYKIAAIVTIQAATYEEAVKKAENNLSLKTIMNDETVDIVYDYESDNEGQRVVYLPGIDSTGPDADDQDALEEDFWKKVAKDKGLPSIDDVDYTQIKDMMGPSNKND